MKLINLCLALLVLTIVQQNDKMKEITKNNMRVRWKLEHGQLRIVMQAPTTGWVAIGLNESRALPGTYLVMARIRDGKPEVVEHYTFKPGQYTPLTELGLQSQIVDISGEETKLGTRITFAIPMTAASTYHKELKANDTWSLLMAFSAEDDFQRHSIMRTSAGIKL